MARKVDQAKLPEYRGNFSWVAATLRAHIEAVMPEHDRHDPKTWPVITSEYIRSFSGHEYDGTKLLPPYVAYERGLVNKCVAHFPDQEIKIMRADGPEFRGLYFHHFPFVFNFQGQARNFEFMHADHYIKWASGITRTVPTTRTKGKDVPTPPFSTAFTECLEMLKEAQSKPSVDDAESSKQELKDALTEEKRQHDYTKNGREAERKMLQYANMSWDKETTRANAAEECNEQQAKLLISKDAELRAAKDKIKILEKESATAKKQINFIRDELKKMRANETRKRPADKETPEARWKRSKTDFEE